MISKSIIFFKKDKGASAVEFALILPILVILVFGIVELGLAFNQYITITHAAREGARDDIIIGVDSEEDPPSIGDPVWVEITYNFGISIPLVGSWEVPLKNKAIMRLENYMN